MLEVPEGLCPVSVICQFISTAPMTGINRAQAGDYGPLHFPHGIACIETPRLAAAVGKPIPHANILAAHKKYRTAAALARQTQRAKLKEVQP